MVLSELQYFPPISFVSALFRESYILFDVYEPYRKMTFRNRCMVTGAQGIISLSIPLISGRNQILPMNEVKISNQENWQARHFKSVESAYNRSPFFDHYRDELATIYKKPFNLLKDWNLHCLGWLKEKMDWPAEIRFTEKAIPFKEEGYNDQRNLMLPKNYSHWNPVKYRQVFEERTGFFANLSVLDLLFNTGPEAGELLKTSVGV